MPRSRIRGIRVFLRLGWTDSKRAKADGYRDVIASCDVASTKSTVQIHIKLKPMVLLVIPDLFYVYVVRTATYVQIQTNADAISYMLCVPITNIRFFILHLANHSFTSNFFEEFTVT
jgi:hypothetical protein